ncbi:Mitochondrial substrate carrier family protein [Hibiscus syriacus]|uniref:Mitochondrial substrate carrier family protein n=1 Tax=Hibiscus syriacus TaxID=106335 RepID=A0A6A3B505_HIBSY|nr:Mitochondrial substrate carrier family protein [Hibiscus syriacus]
MTAIFGNGNYCRDGIQHRKNSWQDSVLGTNFPIPQGRITLITSSRTMIPIPYDPLADDYTLMIGYWFNKGHTNLKKILDINRNLGRADDDHINRKMAKGDGKGHNMKLVEMEGSHTVQNDYELLDVHVEQCYTILVTTDKEPRDYYVVALFRFTKRESTTMGIIRYLNGKGGPSYEIPKPPVGWAWSLNQFCTFQWNLTASAARPNPQGSYKYGGINITRTITLANTAEKVDGKLRYAINGVSFVEPTTPLKLAEHYRVADKVFKYNIFQMSHHVEIGKWSPEKWMNYNLLDAVRRHTIQVFAHSRADVLISLDKCGMYNIRSKTWDKQYVGKQLYISLHSPNRSVRDEYNLPEDVMTCGVVEGMSRPPPFSS